jgi:hypothetical protein
MPELRVFICKHVFDKSRPILLVANMEGDLCFLCGGPHPDDPDAYEAVGLNHILEMDPTVTEPALNLSENWEAVRTADNMKWQYVETILD